jgi:tellurite methyltransferase
LTGITIDGAEVMVQTPDSYWNSVYESQPFKYGKQPSRFLHDNIDRLQSGKVLDIAMGEGRQAIYLAQKGFEVKGFDISQRAVETAAKFAKESGVEIEAKRADMDLFIMGLMEYDSIVMMYFRPSVTRYYNEMVRALKQGGTLLVESYTVEEMKEPIGKDEEFRNFYFTHNELLRNLKGFRILFYQEGEVDGRHVVQCLAQKPLDKDAVKYNLFDMHTKKGKSQDSHHRQLAEQFFKKSED